MARSVRTLVAAVMTLALASCAARKPPLPPQPETTALLAIAHGVPIVGEAALPPGFRPMRSRAPIWLRGGRDIVVSGAQDQRTTVSDFEAPALNKRRRIAADYGPPFRDGVLADLAPSPDATALAIAIVRPAGKRLEVVSYNPVSGETKSVAAIDRLVDSARMTWAKPKQIALVVGQRSAPASGKDGKLASTLYFIPIDGSGHEESIPLNCAAERVTWAPDGGWAVGQGGPDAPPVIIDAKKKTCLPMKAPGPINVLGWAPKRRAFLYTAPIDGGPVPGAFEYDFLTAHSAPVAVSSSAVAYVSDESVLALGNRELALQRVLENPRALVTTEAALIDLEQTNIRVVPFGVRTEPAMLAASTMTYATASATAAIELYAPAGTQALRHIIAYPLATSTPALLASGPARGLALMSWSPDGKLLAILDGDRAATRLTVLEPARARVPLPKLPTEAIPPPPLGAVPPPAIH